MKGRRPLGPLLFATLLACVASPPLAEAAPRLPWPVLFTQLPVEPTEALCSPEVDGARLVLLAPDGGLRVLSEGFQWAGEAALSFDGERVLFAGRRRRGAPRSIWEMPLGGGTPRRVTAGRGDCGEPIYMTRNALEVPEFAQRVPWFAYTSDQAGAQSPLGGRTRDLYASTLQPVPGRGVVTWRTSFGPGGARAPRMLSDGRVLYSAWIHTGQAPEGARTGAFLLAMNWAGTGLNELYGAQRGAPVETMPAQLPDQSVVFVESEEPTACRGGDLARISWARPLRSRALLASDGARYRDPAPLPDGRVLVSRRSGPGSFALVTLAPEIGAVSEAVYDDPQWHEVDALAVLPRKEPMGRIATVWDDRFHTGSLLCLDAYDSDRPELQRLKRGAIRSVRVVQALPRPAAGDELPPFDPDAPFGATAALRTRILGEAPVMADGSFHLELPADTPFTLQILDAEGVALRTMRSWIWLRPWNRRTCVGCHANPELAPPNVAPTATRSLLLPRLDDATATRSPDFVHDVRPILTARCAGGCHGLRAARRDPMPLLLDDWETPPYDRAYTELVPRYVVPGAARTSPLMRRLRAAPPAPHAAVLLPAELRTLAAWIDLGAQWDATRYDIPVPTCSLDGPGRGSVGSSGPCGAAGERGSPAVRP